MLSICNLRATDSFQRPTASGIKRHANIHHAAHSANSRRQRRRKARRLTQNSRKDYSKTRHPGISKRAFTLKTVTVKWQEPSGAAGCFLRLFSHRRLGDEYIC